MTKASRKFAHHYAEVAIVVGLLSSFGTWTENGPKLAFISARRF